MGEPQKNSLELSAATRNKYLKSLLVQLGGLRAAMEKSDFSAVGATCHKLQGSAGLFGMQDLGDACRSMELAAQANEQERVVEAFQVVEVIITRNAGGPLDAQISA